MKTILYCLPLLVAGCAATSAPAPPAQKGFEPKLARFAAPPPADDGAWAGSYAGRVDFYDSSLESWQKDSAISLIVQPEGEGGLRLLGHVMLSAGRRSFLISGIPEPRGGTIAGEYTDSNSFNTTQYIYALTLNGSFITGTVKTAVRRDDDDRFDPADEWRFNAERLSGFQPR